MDNVCKALPCGELLQHSLLIGYGIALTLLVIIFAKVITALYERLSRDDFGKDDDQQRESNSISNQKAMLEEFAARQGFTNIVHFTDDGISGTCFDRPGFLAMMKEVEAGNVEYLCIKDMSRMGRDYLKVGQIMEILRQRGVRLIAINDGVDSARVSKKLFTN